MKRLLHTLTVSLLALLFACLTTLSPKPATANLTLEAHDGQATVSLINNKGDIGATLKELGSSSNLRSLAAAIDAGFAALASRATVLLKITKAAIF